MKQKAHQEVFAIGALGTPSFIAHACAPLLRSNEYKTSNGISQTSLEIKIRMRQTYDTWNHEFTHQE